MPINEGNLIEKEVIASLNEKRVIDLSNNMRTLVRNLYGVLDDYDLVICKKVDDSYKTDFVISINDIERCVSMKTGRATVVHNEIFSNFINFLSGFGVSKDTLDTIALFQFGDGSIDGNGGERKSYQEIMKELGPKIKLANKELNQNREFVMKVVERCVFKGSCEYNIEADAIYFGNKEYGIVATRKQIEKHIRRRSFDYYDNLHIGPLLLRPDARYVDKEVTYERKRQRIVCYWPNLSADIEYIAKRYDYDY